MLMLSNATNQSTVEFGYMCPRGLTGQPAVTLTKLLKYKTILLLRCIHHFKIGFKIMTENRLRKRKAKLSL